MARKTPSSLSTATESERALSKAVFDSDLTLGHRAVDWFNWLVDDCLANFGKRLEQPWEKKQNDHLFELGKLYGKAVVENPFKDILGSIYQELASNFGKKGMGQYFTPNSLAGMMTAINYNRAHFENQEVVRFYEPASGSGVFPLSFMKTVLQDNPEFMKKLSITCVDLDLLCVKMTVLQVLGNNLMHDCHLGEIKVYHGNSLGDPNNLDVFYHASTPDYMKREQEEHDRKTTQAEELKANTPEPPTKSKVKAPEPKQPEEGQLNLF